MGGDTGSQGGAGGRVQTIIHCTFGTSVGTGNTICNDPNDGRGLFGGNTSDPGRSYPNPAIAQSMLKGIVYQLRYAAVQQVCGQNEDRRVLRSMRNGAIVGATKGAYTGFVSGELFGGEVTLGASGLGGAALGGFVGGTLGATKGVFIGTAAALVCKAGGAYN